MEVFIMAKSENINIRIEPELKKEAEETLDYLGLTMAEAIKLFLKQVTLTDSIPFKIEKPKYNKETLEAMKEAKAIMENPEEYKAYSSVNELMEDLNKDE